MDLEDIEEHVKLIILPRCKIVFNFPGKTAKRHHFKLKAPFSRLSKTLKKKKHQPNKFSEKEIQHET